LKSATREEILSLRAGVALHEQQVGRVSGVRFAHLADPLTATARVPGTQVAVEREVWRARR